MQQHVETRHRHRVARVLSAIASAGCSQTGRHTTASTALRHSQQKKLAIICISKQTQARSADKQAYHSHCHQRKAGLLLTPHSGLAEHGMTCRPQRQGHFLPTGNVEHLTPSVAAHIHTPKAAQHHTHPRLHRSTPNTHPRCYTFHTHTTFAVPTCRQHTDPLVIYMCIQLTHIQMHPISPEPAAGMCQREVLLRRSRGFLDHAHPTASQVPPPHMCATAVNRLPC